MRLDPNLLNNVVFLCKGDVPHATAFLVRIEEGGQAWTYLITARHNIKKAKNPVRVRYNDKSKKIAHFDLKKADWECDDTTDVAAYLFYGPRREPPQVEHISIPVQQFVNADLTYSGPPLSAASAKPVVALGDELVFVGLFSQYSGATRNVPIVRFGHVAALPGEEITFRVDDANNFKTTGFLAECKSWGGVSGSPVLWTTTMKGRKKETEMMKGPEEEFTVSGLLGLVSAHFDVLQDAKRTGQFAADDGNIVTPVNSGVAVITPAAFIYALLYRNDFKKARADDLAVIRAGAAPA
jgi:hypothetical protein